MAKCVQTGPCNSYTAVVDTQNISRLRRFSAILVTNSNSYHSKSCDSSPNWERLPRSYSFHYPVPEEREDDERFVHINTWYDTYGSNPCSKTETIYLSHIRSEEPAVSNMDISTGHIVLVSKAI